MKNQSPWTRIQMFPVYLCVLLALCSPVAASASPEAWKTSNITTFDATQTIIIRGIHWIGDEVAAGIAAVAIWLDRN